MIIPKKILECDIPGWMSHPQPAVLYELFSKFDSPKTVGVEIGSLHGRSAWTIANSIPNGRLFAVDVWIHDEKIKYSSDEEYKRKHTPTKEHKNTLEFFIENTKDTKNIIPVTAYSPDDIKEWWQQPIDFVFLDGSHHNPNERNNIDFWLSWLKPNGMIAGHDYNEEDKINRPIKWQHMSENIDYLTSIFGHGPKLFDNTSIWAFEGYKNGQE